ncbi:MAG: hypothetical protein MUE81_23735 [Thermoflexibacter sp.]|nr:hypothetical protein [Thermoflexibacter sp.]
MKSLKLNVLKKFVFVIIVLFMVACSSEQTRYAKSPVDELIKQMDSERNFSIILYDMDIEEKTFGEDIFKHQYKIITEKDSMPQQQITAWYEVGKGFFLQNENNMGMEIASKNEGQLSKVAAPPGYNRYVGNSQYGQWSTGSNGTSFWEFYGQYAFMSSMFGLASNLMYRNQYDNYRGTYMGRQPYYGQLSDGRPAFGTYSSHGEKANPDFYKRTGGASSFKEKVSSRVNRSNSSGNKSSDRYNSSSSSKKRSSSGRSSGRRRR